MMNTIAAAGVISRMMPRLIDRAFHRIDVCPGEIVSDEGEEGM